MNSIPRIASSTDFSTAPPKRLKLERSETVYSFEIHAHHLNISDLILLELVSKKTQQIAHALFIRLAERYGYGVDDPETAKWCLNKLLNHVDLLHEKGCLPFAETNRLRRFYALHQLSKRQIFQFLSQAKYVFEKSDGDVLKIFELPSAWLQATDTPEDLNDSALAVNNAAYYKKIPLLKMLIEQRASVGPFTGGDYCSEWGAPLHGAVEAVSLKAIPLLLEFKADINQITRMGTPLDVAFTDTQHGRFAELVELLLSHQADPNISAPMRLSPLALAARAGLPHIVKTLILHNADIHTKSSTGLTPLDFANGAEPSLHDKGYTIYRYNSDVIQLLQEQ